jgi:hypothetical protein
MELAFVQTLGAPAVGYGGTSQLFPTLSYISNWGRYVDHQTGKRDSRSIRQGIKKLFSVRM